MKSATLVFCACVALCLTGCYTSDSAVIANGGGDHVVINNYGWKFFDWIPLACGNASEDATIGTVFFRDDVTMEKMQKRFAGYAGGRTIECPAYDVSDTKFFRFFGIPIPYIITYKEITLSGTMK